jgi:hypothetical protein
MPLGLRCQALRPNDPDVVSEQDAACRGLLLLHHSCGSIRLYLDLRPTRKWLLVARTEPRSHAARGQTPRRLRCRRKGRCKERKDLLCRDCLFGFSRRARLSRNFGCAGPRHSCGRNHPRVALTLRIGDWVQIVKDSSRTHDCDDYSCNKGSPPVAWVFCFSVDLHVLPNSLFDVREADVGTQSARRR